MLEAVKPYRCDNCEGRGYFWIQERDKPGTRERRDCSCCKGTGKIWLTNKEATEIEEREAAE